MSLIFSVGSMTSSASWALPVAPLWCIYIHFATQYSVLTFQTASLIENHLSDFEYSVLPSNAELDGGVSSSTVWFRSASKSCQSSWMVVYGIAVLSLSYIWYSCWRVAIMCYTSSYQVKRTSRFYPLFRSLDVIFAGHIRMYYAFYISLPHAVQTFSFGVPFQVVGFMEWN